MVAIAIKLGADRPPGLDLVDDAEWAAMVALAPREVLNQGGVDEGLGVDSLRLLDRVDQMLGQWGDDWPNLVGQQVTGSVDAGRRGRLHG